MSSLNELIEQIAGYVRKYAPLYDVKVYSPIIAQGILESGRGTSKLALSACNYFGLKYKKGRCPTVSGIYHKVGSEQNADGTYTSSAMQWCKFDSLEQCVIGYFDFTNITRYSNLKGVTDPKEYLQRIKADGYATSIDYVDNLLRVIESYDLTKYDREVLKVSKIIAIDAGHGMSTAGKRCMKALDPNETREWFLNDRIADRLQELLAGYDCKVIRVDDTTGVKDVPLATRVRTANAAKADVYVSIHHNAGIGGRIGGGTVVFYCSNKAERLVQARRMYQSVINETGLSGNRSSTVINKGFYVIKNTSMPAFLIENGFMDSQTDINIILSASHSEKTAQGLLHFLVEQYCLEPKSIQIKAPVTQQTSICYPAYTGKKTTLVAAMTSLCIVSTYANRKQIAVANGIKGYMGTAAQNTQIYNLLVAGLLKKVR